MSKLRHLFALFCVALTTSCQMSPTVVCDDLPCIFPDYVGVTVPVNIAPLNFMVRQADCVQATFSHNNLIISTSSGRFVDVEPEKWSELLTSASGDSVAVDVVARTNGVVTKFGRFYIHVSPDSIDNYLSYREIEPGYEVWHKVQIVQREVSSFATTTLAKWSLSKNACMNCHTYNKRGQSFFHLRSASGGTIVSDHGRLRKINTNTSTSGDPAVYGELSPCGRFGVFSTNVIIPALHHVAERRLEVFDTKSDLILLDLEQLTTRKINVAANDNALETFPAFSADGKKIYFCSATTKDSIVDCNELKYSILALDFDADTGVVADTFSTVWSAEMHNLSASFPKASPDGRWLLFTTSSSGTFPIWHREADLAMLDIATGEVVDISNVNSSLSDTYHSWSSNSRWFVFASKRGDGVYGRPYFAHVSDDGTTSKPFMLPMSDPESVDNSLVSFNIPELSPIAAGFDAFDIERLLQTCSAERMKLEN